MSIQPTSGRNSTAFRRADEVSGAPMPFFVRFFDGHKWTTKTTPFATKEDAEWEAYRVQRSREGCDPRLLYLYRVEVTRRRPDVR